MPLRVFPVATTNDGAPVYADDFNLSSQGRPHHGIDIFAAEGTPVLAPDDGKVTLTSDGIPGGPGCPPPLSFHEDATDGTFYFGTHLSGFRVGANVGDTFDVQAGDLIGFVGHGGNACQTAAHLHFEKHVNGEPVDPFADLRAAQGLTVTQGPGEPTPRGFTFTLGAKALAAAYREKHGTDPPDALALCMSQAIAEGTFARTFLGTNNFGSMHATKGFEEVHRDDPGFGLLAHLESGATGFYVGPFRIHPSALIGARAFLDLVESMLGASNLSLAEILATDTEAYAKALYLAGYFVGPHPQNVTPLSARREAFAAGVETTDDDDNVEAYSKAIASHLGEANSAIANMATDQRDPAAISVGPPFADLAARLTVGRAPHTIDHARKLLGANADNPPGGALSLADTLAAPDGPGVWLFGPHHARPPEPRPSPSPATLPASSSSSSSSVVTAVLLTMATVTAGALTTRAIESVSPIPRRQRA